MRSIFLVLVICACSWIIDCYAENVAIRNVVAVKEYKKKKENKETVVQLKEAYQEAVESLCDLANVTKVKKLDKMEFADVFEKALKKNETKALSLVQLLTYYSLEINRLGSNIDTNSVKQVQ